MKHWWTSNGCLPFPNEFAFVKTDSEHENFNYAVKFVELHGREFRWGQARYSSVSELKKKLLDRWHGYLYPILDQKVLETRQAAAAITSMSADSPSTFGSSLTDGQKAAPAQLSPPSNVTDEAILREAVWRKAIAAAAVGGDKTEDQTSSRLLSPLLRRQADLLVDVLGGIIAKDAAPESLCYWQPSPCFPLSRGGLRQLPNLLPLHSEAYRDLGDLLLAAVVREVANADHALSAATHANGAGVATGRFFVVQDVKGAEAGGVDSPGWNAGGDGGTEGPAEAAGAALRLLRVGPSPAAVAVLWDFVLGALTTTAIGPPEQQAAGVTAAAAAAAVPERKAADEDAKGEAAAALLLQDLLCTNWAGLLKGMLGRSLPFRLLELCGRTDKQSAATATATAVATTTTAATKADSLRSLSAPTPVAPTTSAVEGLLRMYLDCTALGETPGGDFISASGGGSGGGGGGGSGGGSGGGGGGGSGGGGGGGGKEVVEGNDVLLRRARDALAAVLGWRPTGRRPALADLLIPSAESNDPRVGGGSDQHSAGPGATTALDGVQVTDAIRGEWQTEEKIKKEAAVLSSAPAAAAAAAAPVLVPALGCVRRSVGLWIPTTRRPAPLCTRSPHPLLRPDDYVLWPPEPHPVARWILLDVDMPIAAVGAEENAPKSASQDSNAAAPNPEHTALDPESTARHKHGTNTVAGTAAAESAVAMEDTFYMSSSCPKAEREDGGGSSGDGGESISPGDWRSGNVDDGDGSRAGRGAEPDANPNPNPDRTDSDLAFALPQLMHPVRDSPANRTDCVSSLVSGSSVQLADAEGAAAVAATGALTATAATAAAEQHGGDGGRGGGVEAAAREPGDKARTPQQTDRSRRAERRRAVALQAAAAAAGRFDLIASAGTYEKTAVPLPQERAPTGSQAGKSLERTGAQPSGDTAAATASGTNVTSPHLQPLLLPGLRHLPLKVAASLEQAFADAAAASIASGNSASYRRSFQVPIRDGGAAPVAAPGGTRNRAAAIAAAALASAADGPQRVVAGTIPEASGTSEPHLNPAQAAAVNAEAAAAGPPPPPPPLPGLLQLPPEAARPMEEAFRQAAAGGHTSYHLRGSQARVQPPLSSSAEVGPSNLDGGFSSGAAVARAWGRNSSPSQLRLNSIRTQPDGERYYASVSHNGGLYRPHTPHSVLTAPPPASVLMSQVSRCSGLLGAGGYVTYRQEEEEVRVGQYQNFVYMTQHCRKTGRATTGGGNGDGVGGNG